MIYNWILIMRMKVCLVANVVVCRVVEVFNSWLQNGIFNRPNRLEKLTQHSLPSLIYQLVIFEIVSY